jgi:DNA polymerase III gamma/tau subunit
MTELYKKHRPKTLKGVIGNESTVKALQNMIARKTVPHTILFQGPSGCGKTTLARILKTELKCGDMDFQELNCADFRGIDTIRDISRTMNLAPVSGGCRIWLLDEFHQMTGAGQNSALKIFEDTPDHVYFFLCTTDPQKLIKTIQTRCCQMPVENLTEPQMKKLLLRVSKRAKIQLTQETAENIIDASEGSARMALVILDKIKNIPPKEQAEAIAMQEEAREGIELCRALIKKDTTWASVAKILKELKAEPESIRWAVMGYCKSILLKKVDHHIFHVLTCFEKPFYDSKENGLVRACYQAVNSD